MTATLTVVSRVYGRADGARCVLSYRAGRDGVHRVNLTSDGEVETWKCASVEAARARWAVLAKRLRERDFVPMGGAS